MTLEPLRKVLKLLDRQGHAKVWDWHCTLKEVGLMIHRASAAAGNTGQQLLTCITVYSVVAG